MCEAEDFFDVQTENLVKARKEHQCDACREKIRIGDRYVKYTSLYDGRWDTHVHCLRCAAITKALFKSGVKAVDWNLNCGEVWEDPPEEVARLAFLTQDEAQKLGKD